jgi:acetate kinase
MIAKVEKMDMIQENYKEGKKDKDMLENHKENESKTMLSQLKETMNDHRDIGLPEILKVKHRIVTRIEDFDIDCVFDEETNVNVMP